MEYKYSTINEVNHFEFGEAVVGDIQLTERMFHLVLDNVKICPENSCNRDIRMMRTNELLFKISDAEIISLVEEGYNEYDADGNEVIGDLYTVFYDKEKGIITDPSVLFPDAPKLKEGIKGTVKPQVVKKDNRIPANTIIKEKVDKSTPGAMMSGSTIYLDLKKLGKHPHAK